MTTDILSDRKRALEEAFFARRNQELLVKLKQEMAYADWKSALAQITGKDPAIIDELFHKGVERATISALALVPMVEVAWANGSVSSAERAAVLRAAVENDVPKDGPGYHLLEEWLHDNPKGTLLPAWKAYIQSLAGTLSPQGRAFLKEEIGRRSLNVAKAAGGFLGIGDKVSLAEQKVLREIEETLSSLG